MKAKKHIVSMVAICNDCGWVWDDYKDALKKSNNHAKKHKHKVLCEVGVSYTYNGK